jgi:hypothetical protein
VDTKERALALMCKRPSWNMADIAREIGVSRERVRQLIGYEFRQTQALRDKFKLALQQAQVLAYSSHSVPSWKERCTEYHAYRAAKARCTNPKHPLFPWYGARGIEFRFKCFTQFWRELGPRPDGMELDRIENNGHYDLGNVHWTTHKKNTNNRRQPIMRLGKKFDALLEQALA